MQKIGGDIGQLEQNLYFCNSPILLVSLFLPTRLPCCFAPSGVRGSAADGPLATRHCLIVFNALRTQFRATPFDSYASAFPGEGIPLGRTPTSPALTMHRSKPWIIKGLYKYYSRNPFGFISLCNSWGEGYPSRGLGWLVLSHLGRVQSPRHRCRLAHS
jgi:hypothetical protein